MGRVGRHAGPDDDIDDELTALLDDLAAATVDPGATATELDRLLADDRLCVPPVVRNHLRQADEPLTS